MPPVDAEDATAPASKRKIWMVVFIATLGSFITQLDATIVNVSLSTLTRELHSNLQTIHWVTSGYLLALALVLPLNGWLVDRIGAKQLYIWCFATFTLTSALCGLARSADSLVGFRILQGLSGGLLAPMSQMMIARVAGRNMAQVMGFAAVPILLAPILGPVVAGVILEFASWRWLFLINMPIGIFAIVMTLLLLSRDRGNVERRFLDVVGLLLLSPGLVALLYASDWLPAQRGVLPLLMSLPLLIAFFFWARQKGDQALIDLRLFKAPAFSSAVIVQFGNNGVAFTGQMLLPIYLIQACAESPGKAGLLLMPLGVGMMCVYPLMGYFTNRFGVRAVSFGGALLALLGTLPLAYLGFHGLVVGIFVFALFVRGAGMGAIGVPSVSAAYASVARRDQPMASTAINIVQRLGGPALTTIMSTFLGWRMRTTQGAESLSNVFMGAFLLLAAFHALLALLALRLPQTLVQIQNRDPSGKEGTLNEDAAV